MTFIVEANCMKYPLSSSVLYFIYFTIYTYYYFSNSIYIYLSVLIYQHCVYYWIFNYDTIRKQSIIIAPNYRRMLKAFYIVDPWTLKLIGRAFCWQSIAHSNSYNLSIEQPLRSLCLFPSRDLYTTFSESNLRLIRSTFWRSRLRRDLRSKRLEFLQLSLMYERLVQRLPEIVPEISIIA